MQPMFRRLLIPGGLVALVAALLGILWLVLVAFIAVSVRLSPPSFEFASKDAWSFLSLCFGTGGMTMAAVQIWRTLLPVRGYFQKGELLKWLQISAPSGFQSPAWGGVLGMLDLPHVSAHEALREFEGRARRNWDSPAPTERDDGWSALFHVQQIYDLPIEQLCGQLTVAFDSAVNQPERFPHFLLSVIGPDGGEDLARAVASAPRLRKASGSIDDATARTDTQAHAALTRMGQTRIEAFQIDAGGRWRRRLRFVVLAVSLVCSWLITAGSLAQAKQKDVSRISYLFQSVLRPVVPPAGDLIGYLFYSVLVGFIAAYLAMLLRDLTAIVEVKRRQT